MPHLWERFLPPGRTEKASTMLPCQFESFPLQHLQQDVQRTPTAAHENSQNDPPPWMCRMWSCFLPAISTSSSSTHPHWRETLQVSGTDKKYRYPDNFNNHLLSLLQVCWQAFAHSSVLKLHIRKHTGEKPFECPICSVGFSQLPHLKKHMLSIHNQDKSYLCKSCNIFFKTKLDHQNHMASCSPEAQSAASVEEIIDRNVRCLRI